MAFCIFPNADRRIQLGLSVFQSFLLSKTKKIMTVRKPISYVNAVIGKKWKLHIYSSVINLHSYLSCFLATSLSE